ncbi:MAG: leucine-rich repeat domain-containing protein, partial [Thermoguttaceae bacterium]|nr:leucine-rich repeat domain-containing protein [Thermoguttaceae bacterium]
MRKEKIDGVVETVADKASDFRWAFDERGATLTAVKGKTLTRAVVPAEVDGVPVVALGDEAFKDCRALTSVAIPASLTALGNEAFKGCASLAAVEFPAGLTTFGNEAFKGCASLAAVEFPAGLTTLGSEAFFGCEALE